jgi:RNA polymerase sigma factor for flagellar operon FliA
VNLEQLFLDNLGVIDQVVRFVARRNGLMPDEAEELSSSIKLKIIEDDYEVLRKFQQRSSLRTFLTAVVQRHFLDQRIAKWGRWRPSVLARRLGPAIVLLDQLITRDGLPVDEAVERVQAQCDDSPSLEELTAIASQLPARSRRQFVGEEALQNLPGGESADRGVVESEARDDAERADRALAATLAGLENEDRLILRLRFQQGLQIAQIARVTGLEQKPLYRRLELLMQRLRRELEARGISREHVAAVVGHEGGSFASSFTAEPRENLRPRPSL